MNHYLLCAVKTFLLCCDFGIHLIPEYEKNGLPKNFVDQVFGGELTSTVMCQQCKTVRSSLSTVGQAS